MDLHQEVAADVERPSAVTAGRRRLEDLDVVLPLDLVTDVILVAHAVSEPFGAVVFVELLVGETEEHAAVLRLDVGEERRAPGITAVLVTERYTACLVPRPRADARSDSACRRYRAPRRSRGTGRTRVVDRMRRPQAQRVTGLVRRGARRAGGAEGADEERDGRQRRAMPPSYHRAPAGGPRDARSGEADTLPTAPDAHPLHHRNRALSVRLGRADQDLPYVAHAGRRPPGAAARLHPRGSASASIVPHSKRWACRPRCTSCRGRWPREVWFAARSLAGAPVLGRASLQSPGVRGRWRPRPARWRPDLVYCDHLSMAEYGVRLGLPIVYDAHNVEYTILRRSRHPARRR